MTTLFHSKDASEDYPCVVKIDESEVLVEYDDDGLVQYKGSERGPGHYELSAPEVHGKASLHSFDGSSFLEGSWVEDGYRGMWRIELA